MPRNSALTLGALVIFSTTAFAVPLQVDSYEMPNGETGLYSYHDESYKSTGALEDLAILSGGLGDLTDGVIADDNFDVVETNGTGPYVGWKSIDPTITFNFDSTVTIHEITLYLDDANGFGGVNLPSSVDLSMGGDSRNIGLFDPNGGEPLAFHISDLNLTGTAIDLTLNRQTRWVMLSEVEFSGVVEVPPLPCDFDGDGELGAGDIDLLFEAIRAGTNDPEFDITGDGMVEGADIVALVQGPDKLNTYIGDSNLDGVFDSSDFIQVFQAAEYEDDIPLNSRWATGDWNGDGEFDSFDFVAAFQAGGYDLPPREDVQAVPEPASIALLVVGLAFVSASRRRSGIR